MPQVKTLKLLQYFSNRVLGDLMLPAKECCSCYLIWYCRRGHRSCSIEKGVLRNFAKFTAKHLCQSLFFNKVALVQVFCCGFCEISKNTFSTEDLQTTAPVLQFKCFYFENMMMMFTKISLDTFVNLLRSSMWQLENTQLFASPYI